MDGLRNWSHWWWLIIGVTIGAAVIVVICFCMWANARLKWFTCCARKKGIQQGACASCRCCRDPLSLRLCGPCCCCFVFLLRRIKNKKDEIDQHAERKAAKRERLGKTPDEEVSSEDEDNQAAWNEGTTIGGVTLYSKERRQAERARERAEDEAQNEETHHAIEMARTDDNMEQKEQKGTDLPPLVESEIKRVYLHHDDDHKGDVREIVVVASPSSASRGLQVDPEPEYDLHLQPMMPIPPPTFPPSKPAGSILGASRRGHGHTPSITTSPLLR